MSEKPATRTDAQRQQYLRRTRGDLLVRLALAKIEAPIAQRGVYISAIDRVARAMLAEGIQAPSQRQAELAIERSFDRARAAR